MHYLKQASYFNWSLTGLIPTFTMLVSITRTSKGQTWKVVRCISALSCCKQGNRGSAELGWSQVWDGGFKLEKAWMKKPAYSSLTFSWRMTQRGLLSSSSCLLSKTSSFPSWASVYVIYPEKGILEHSYKILSKDEAQTSFLAKRLLRMCLNMRLLRGMWQQGQLLFSSKHPCIKQPVMK